MAGLSDSSDASESSADSSESAGLKLTPQNITLKVKETYQLKTEADDDLNWESTDVSIATVSDTGLVEGLQEGVTVIRVKSAGSNAEAQCVVTVTAQGSEEDAVAAIASQEDSGRWWENMPLPLEAALMIGGGVLLVLLFVVIRLVRRRSKKQNEEIDQMLKEHMDRYSHGDDDSNP